MSEEQKIGKLIAALETISAADGSLPEQQLRNMRAIARRALKEWHGEAAEAPPGEVEPQRDRAAICDVARLTITKGRNNVYGEPEDSFAIIAGGWSWYLGARGKLAEGAEIAARDVAELMSLLKTGRMIGGTYKHDNFIDRVGYDAIAGELAAREQEEKERDSAK